MAEIQMHCYTGLELSSSFITFGKVLSQDPVNMVDYQMYTSQELIRLLKSGDQLAYTQIYDRYKTLLFNHAYKKLGDAAEAGDVIQDVFLVLWNRKSDIDTEGNLSGYLYTAVRNRILNLFAQRKVRDRYESSVLEFEETGMVQTDHLIRERQMATLIDREIAALPEKMRRIFLLSRQDHLKNKEIAAMLGLSEHTVATQLKRALKQLRLRLGLVLYVALMLKLNATPQTKKTTKINPVPCTRSF